MSVFSCIERITITLEDIARAKKPVSSEDLAFLTDIKARLRLIAQSGDYSSIESIRVDVNARLKNRIMPLIPSIRDALTDISSDLKAMGSQTRSKDDERDMLESLLSQMPNIGLSPPILPDKFFADILPISPDTRALATLYDDLRSSRLTVKSFTQGRDIPTGDSKGECYGFVKSMADHSLSLYNPANADKPLVFNQTVYDYQQNQSDRAKDQTGVKTKRISRKYFCPSTDAQANALYHYAKAHQGKDLLITLSGKIGSHATYLFLQNDGKIRYMDPNHGAFLFDNKEQFIAAYRIMYLSQGNPFQYYKATLLIEDKENKIPESFTLMGKLRSLLTGAKYPENYHIAPHLNGFIGGLIGAGIGALIGSFVFPVIGTFIGGGVGFFIAGLAASVISIHAEKRQHQGLLGPYHWMREQFSTQQVKPENVQALRQALNLGAERGLQGSYHQMASLLGGAVAPSIRREGPLVSDMTADAPLPTVQPEKGQEIGENMPLSRDAARSRP